jgi:hypothetical protein
MAEVFFIIWRFPFPDAVNVEKTNQVDDVLYSILLPLCLMMWTLMG